MHLKSLSLLLGITLSLGNPSYTADDYQAKISSALATSPIASIEGEMSYERLSSREKAWVDKGKSFLEAVQKGNFTEAAKYCWFQESWIASYKPAERVRELTDSYLLPMLVGTTDPIVFTGLKIDSSYGYDYVKLLFICGNMELQIPLHYERASNDEVICTDLLDEPDSVKVRYRLDTTVSSSEGIAEPVVSVKMVDADVSGLIIDEGGIRVSKVACSEIDATKSQDIAEIKAVCETVYALQRRDWKSFESHFGSDGEFDVYRDRIEEGVYAPEISIREFVESSPAAYLWGHTGQVELYDVRNRSGIVNYIFYCGDYQFTVIARHYPDLDKPMWRVLAGCPDEMVSAIY